MWARYDSAASKHYLLLYIGEKSTQFLALDANTVPDHEIQIIRANLNNLKTMGIDQIIQFLIKHAPISYRTAFRRFQKDRITIMKSYGLKELTPKPNSPR
jgi:hypothetical protein